MVVKTLVVSNDDSMEFSRLIQNIINDYRHDGYRTEIHYSVNASVYTAMILVMEVEDD